jgi:diguanylate cyclase (GGDEF)-like protein
MHKLFAKQLERATTPEGLVDTHTLSRLVCATYEDFERDRRRADRANALMADELTAANRQLGQAVDALKLQNQRFGAALDNMSQGLCLFGADQRLVVCNDRFTRMFDLPLAETLVGMRLDEFIARAEPFRSMTTGAIQRAEAYVRLSTSPDVDMMHLECADGRVLTVAHEPLDDGGFVHTFEDVTSRRIAEDRIVHLATHDALTDLPNRVLLRQRLEASLSAGHGNGNGACAVLCLDLDRFKPVNDTLGHAAGDAVLQQVTQRLRENVRSLDTVARLGGDEFAVVFAGVEAPERAEALAQRLVQEISRPYSIGGHDVIIGVSIGIAMAPRDGVDPERLIKSADMALYHAKKEGRGRFCFFEAQMDALAQTRRALEMDLRNALDQGELEAHYQPLIALETREVCGFEALMRWNSPTRGRVPPDVFIPLAEELGLIGRMGAWILHEACRAATKWPASVKIAVNVSAKQFKHGALLEVVSDALAASGLPAQRLELEITETVLMDHERGTLDLLHALRALGVSIVMDDFGTGYSSLAYLRSFPFDKVKIDRSFVSGLGRQADAMAIVRAVTGLCNSLGIPSTAEGVETGEQLDLLDGEQCTQVQGYLFSKPRPESDLPELLRALSAAANASASEVATADTQHAG